MSRFLIRAAQESDAEGINQVYNPYIRESAITFETEEYSDARRRRWIATLAESGKHPVLVAEDSDRSICGFAGAAPFDPRGAYATSIKTSVFLTPESAGQGVAKRLYQALFGAIDDAGFHRAYALIVEPNPASVALHEGCGFNHVMTLSEVGRKFGRYHNVMWFEKRL